MHAKITRVTVTTQKLIISNIGIFKSLFITPTIQKFTKTNYFLIDVLRQNYIHYLYCLFIMIQTYAYIFQSPNLHVFERKPEQLDILNPYRREEHTDPTNKAHQTQRSSLRPGCETAALTAPPPCSSMAYDDKEKPHSCVFIPLETADTGDSFQTSNKKPSPYQQFHTPLNLIMQYIQIAGEVINTVYYHSTVIYIIEMHAMLRLLFVTGNFYHQSRQSHSVFFNTCNLTQIQKKGWGNEGKTDILVTAAGKSFNSNSIFEKQNKTENGV